MRRIVGTGACGLLVAMLAAGCSAGAPASYRPTFDTCYAFDLQAIQRQITVTTEPPACAGLSREQVNQAVASAVRKAVGSEPKAVARRLAARDGAYLAHIVSTVQPAPAAPPAAVSARTSPGLPLSVAALVAWLTTAAAGSTCSRAGWRPTENSAGVCAVCGRRVWWQSPCSATSGSPLPGWPSG